MDTSLKDKRFHLLRAAAAGVVVLVLPAFCAAANAAPAPAANEQKAPEEIDAATKKLMAAQGLYQRGLYKLAAQEYADFLSENPKHAQRTAAMYALALCQYRQNDFERAATLMNSVLKDAAFAQRAEALAVLGQCELAQKHYDKAIAAMDELLEKHKESPHADAAAINHAQALYATSKFADAAAGAQRYLDGHPKGAQRAAALYFVALSLRALGKNEEALAAAQSLQKDYADSRFALDASLIAAQCLEAQGKVDEAIKQYRKMLAIAPADRKSDAEFSLGVALYKAGKFADAIAALTAVTDGQYAAAAKLQLGLTQLALNKIPEARAALTPIAADTDPARAASAKYGLARCDIAEKKFDSARALLSELLQGNPANAPQIALDRAVCLVETSQFEEAAREFRDIVKKYAASAQVSEALYRQAYCLHRLKKFDESHAVCSVLLARDASDFTAPAAELDAENLFMLGKYADAGKAFVAIAQQTKDEDRALRFKLRQGQCAYFAADYAQASELLAPIASNPHTARSADLQPAVFLLGDAQLQQGKFKEAAESLDRYVQISKADTAEARYKLALARLKSDDDAGARKALESLAKLNDDSPWVQRGLVEYGQLLRKMGKGPEAAIALKRVLAANPPPDLAAPATYLLAWTEFDAKHFAPAADLWKQVTETYKTHALAADSAFRLGIALKEAGENDRAAAALQVFAATHSDSPDAPKARQLAAACLSAGGKTEEAGAVLASLARDPKASDAVLYDLAWAQRSGKNASAAAESYRRLLKDHPDSKLAPAVRTELAELLYEDKKYDQAVELLESVIADKSADPKLLSSANYRLGWCYQKLNKPDKAAAAFSKFDPVKGGASEDIAASALLQAGLAYAEQGKFDAAETSLAAMIKDHPKNAQLSVALLRLGEVQAEQGKYDASAQTYSTFLQRFSKDPFAPRAHFGIGWSLENRKQYEQARAEYKKAIAATNGETAARAQFQIGETFLGEGKFDLALPALLAVEDVYAYPKWSARALFESGRVFEELKQPDQAKKQYEQVATKYKDAPEAKLAEERLKALSH